MVNTFDKPHPIRAAIIINSFGMGGAERVVSILIAHLPEMGGQVDLICLEDTFYYQVSLKTKVHLLAKQKRGKALTLLNIFRQSYHLAVLSRKEKYDVILSFLHRADYVSLLSRFFGSKHKAIVCVRNAMAQNSHTGLIGWLNKLLTSLLYPHADALCYQTARIAEEYTNTVGKHKKVFIIPNPVDVEALSTKINEPETIELPENFFCVLGRLVPQKRVDLAIVALQKALSVDRDLPSLVVVGDGPEMENLVLLTARLGLEKKVVFLGTRKNPFPVLSRAQFYVLSSAVEGFPNALIEALACGLPAIASNCVSGPAEILNGEPVTVQSSSFLNAKWGILFDNGNVDALASALVRLSEDVELRRTYSLKAKERAKAFSSHTIVRSFEYMIKTV